MKCNVSTRCSVCKVIHNIKRNKLYRTNSSKRLEYERNWKKQKWNNLTKAQKLDFYKKRKANPNYKKQKSKWDKKYNSIHKDRLNKKRVDRYNSDEVYRQVVLIRNRISLFIKRTSSKNYNSEIKQIIGLDIVNFKSYIESKFDIGMSWGNYGEWSIDHIEPLALAKNKTDVIKMSHYTNLQPLWLKDNLIKGKNA